MPLTKGEFSQDATEYRPQPAIQSRPSGVSPATYDPPVGTSTTMYENTSGMYKTTSSSDSYNPNNMLEDELQYGRKVRIISAQIKK